MNETATSLLLVDSQSQGDNLFVLALVVFCWKLHVNKNKHSKGI